MPAYSDPNGVRRALAAPLGVAASDLAGPMVGGGGALILLAH